MQDTITVSTQFYIDQRVQSDLGRHKVLFPLLVATAHPDVSWSPRFSGVLCDSRLRPISVRTLEEIYGFAKSRWHRFITECIDAGYVERMQVAGTDYLRVTDYVEWVTPPYLPERFRDGIPDGPDTEPEYDTHWDYDDSVSVMKSHGVVRQDDVLRRWARFLSDDELEDVWVHAMQNADENTVGYYCRVIEVIADDRDPDVRRESVMGGGPVTEEMLDETLRVVESLLDENLPDRTTVTNGEDEDDEFDW